MNMGRPSTLKHPRQVMVQIEDQKLADFDRVLSVTGRSRAEMIRYLIDAWMESHGTKMLTRANEIRRDLGMPEL